MEFRPPINGRKRGGSIPPPYANHLCAYTDFRSAVRQHKRTKCNESRGMCMTTCVCYTVLRNASPKPRRPPVMEMRVPEGNFSARAHRCRHSRSSRDDPNGRVNISAGDNNNSNGKAKRGAEARRQKYKTTPLRSLLILICVSSGASPTLECLQSYLPCPLMLLPSGQRSILGGQIRNAGYQPRSNELHRKGW